MTLAEWVEREGRGAIARVARDARIAYKTAHYLTHAVRLPTPAVAIRIEEATGGEVTAAELLGLAASDSEAA